MLGLHRRTRSLISVKELAQYDKLPMKDTEVEMEQEGEADVLSEISVKARHRQVTLVYAVFLAEAIMASSLQPQLQMLVSENDYCGHLSASYLRSILDSAYAFGGIMGIFWGYLADRIGRRRVTLLGLWAMLVCCLSMGFATGVASCTISRCLAGFASSAVVVTTLTMLGDMSQSTQERARNVARLPLAALFGSIGPIAQGMVSESLRASGAVWERYPLLSSQLACGSLIFAIALIASMILQETHPVGSKHQTKPMDLGCEGAALLSASRADDPTISVVDFIHPEPIAIGQFLQAPSLLVLLASFCLLSLHASIFDILLPHLGQSSSQHGGMEIPCSWLGLVVLMVKGVAGITLLHAIPHAVQKFGLVRLYRSASLLFPAIYVLTPVLAVAAASSTGFVAMTSLAGLAAKHTLTGGATVLVSLLVLNTTPDAFSAGTVVGMMQITSLFKALAVAVSGAILYLSNDVGVAITNVTLWSCLVFFGALGAGLAYFVRERPSVEGDFPSEVLCWETCFDVDAEKVYCDA